MDGFINLRFALSRTKHKRVVFKDDISFPFKDEYGERQIVTSGVHLTDRGEIITDGFCEQISITNDELCERMLESIDYSWDFDK